MEIMSKVATNTKNNLAEAFLKLYRIKPVEQISVKEIAELAGYNRCTFYAYFDSVRDILNFAEGNLIEYVKNNILKIPLNDNSDNVICKLAEIYAEKGDCLAIFLQNNNFIKRYKQILKPIFMKHKPFAALPKNTKTDILYEISISAIIGGFNYWYTNRDKIPADFFIMTLRTSLLDMLKNQSG